MANASSHAHAVYKRNTAVLYYEPSETHEDTPVATARVVAVGGASAAPGGGTLQLVGGMAERESPEQFVEGRDERAVQPRVVAVEPPRAAARKRPAEKQPTRVIAYNVRIVAQQDDADVADGAQAYVEIRSDERVDGLDDTDYMMSDRARAAMQQQTPNHARGGTHHEMPKRAHLHPEMQFEVPSPHAGVHREMPQRSHNGASDARFVMPNRAHGRPHNAPFEQPQFPMPNRAPRAARLDTPNAMPGQQHVSVGLPFEAPAGLHPHARSPRGHERGAGSIPMSLFGALENMGGSLHEQARRAAARGQAPATAGSYKPRLAQQLEARHGSLLSNRNLCIAVSAYAFVLFLLASFGG
jgi:hypothetical protein